MDPNRLEEAMSKLPPEQRKALSTNMDDYLDDLESRSSKYMDGWSPENWEKEMEDHPLFTKGFNEGQELSPLLQGIQDLKYSPDENTPAELAANYKEDGNFNFKCKKYRFAAASYSEGLKQRCEDDLLNTQLLTNRAAAQIHVGNLRSALVDCRMALAKMPGHLKALDRAARCCIRLKRFEECIQLCDRRLEDKPGDPEFVRMRADAARMEKEAERDRRRAAAKEKKTKKDDDRLLEAIKSRGITLMGAAATTKLTLDDLEPTHPAALRKKVHFAAGSEQSSLVWPVLLLYPEHGETDFIEEFGEDQRFSGHLAQVFSERAPWDKEGKYSPGWTKLYFESAEEEQLVQVDTGKTLRDVLSDGRYRVAGGMPGFIVIADNTTFQAEFLKKYE